MLDQPDANRHTDPPADAPARPNGARARAGRVGGAVRRGGPFVAGVARHVHRDRSVRRPAPRAGPAHDARRQPGDRQRARLADARPTALGARLRGDPAVARADPDRREPTPDRRVARQRPRHAASSSTTRAQSSPRSTSSTARRRSQLTFADGSTSGATIASRDAATPTSRCSTPDTPPAHRRPGDARQPGARCGSAARPTSSATRSACTAR